MDTAPVIPFLTQSLNDSKPWDYFPTGTVAFPNRSLQASLSTHAELF